MASTIKQIAELAGVAPTTVSLVINDNPKIGGKTREKILKIMDELDYYPNHSGKILKQGCSDSIAVLSSFFQNLFKMDFVNGIEQAIISTKYQLRQFYARQEMEADKCKEILFSMMADAVLAMNMLPDHDFLEKMQKARKPVILVEDVVEGYPGISFNNYEAAYKAVEFFVKKGRKKIAISLATESYKGHLFVDERLRGYLAAVKDLDLEYSSILEMQEYSLESGKKLYHMLGDKNKRPDALFCASGDVTAAGFLQECLVQGLRIPEDISVMGFDDSIIAQSTTLGLTTVRQPVFEMGRAAFDLAVSLIEGTDPDAWTKIIEFKPEIIIRQTT